MLANPLQYIITLEILKRLGFEHQMDCYDTIAEMDLFLLNKSKAQKAQCRLVECSRHGSICLLFVVIVWKVCTSKLNSELETSSIVVAL